MNGEDEVGLKEGELWVEGGEGDGENLEARIPRRRHEEGGSVSVTAAPERADGQLHSVVEVLFWSIIGDEEI